MIRHTAVFRFKTDVTDESISAIDEALTTLPDIIPEIVSFSAGRNIGITETAWDYAVVADFASPQDYATYASNAEHVDMVKNVVGPQVDETARTQFEVTG